MKTRSKAVTARVARAVFTVAVAAVWLSSAVVYAADIDGQRLINSDKKPGN